MKRPRIWLRWVFLIGLLLVLGQYVALTWFVPSYLVRSIERVTGSSVSVASARLSMPLTTILDGLRLANNTPEAALMIQRALIKPRWLSMPSKRLWIDTLELQRPLLRIRRTRTGTLLWPSLATATVPPHVALPSAAAKTPFSMMSFWRVEIASIKIVDGVVEFIDEHPATPFHGVVDHVSLVIGPLVLPIDNTQTSFAARAQMTGMGGHAAPLYCSGWLGLTARDLQASCQLEPLALAAFDPYFHGRAEVRVYTTTLKVTTQWIARANALTSRMQLELGNLSEGDLSVHGRTIVDVKRLMTSADPRLSGEMSLMGLLDAPAQWRAQFLPGGESAKQLVAKLSSFGVQAINIPFWAGKLPMSLASASPAAITHIEAAKKEVEEALELLATPIPPAVPETPASPPAETAAVGSSSAVATSPTGAQTISGVESAGVAPVSAAPTVESAAPQPVTPLSTSRPPPDATSSVHP